MMNFCRLPPDSAAASGSGALLRTSITSMMRCDAAAMAPDRTMPAAPRNALRSVVWRDSSRFSESFMRGAAPWPRRSSGTNAAPSSRRPEMPRWPASLPRMRIEPASCCRASPEIASNSSPWPLPATPAMPITSPALTSRLMFFSGIENGVAGLRSSLRISSEAACDDEASTGGRTTEWISLPTIMRASEAAVSWRGSQWPTTLPCLSTVAESHMRFTSSRRCEM